MIGAREEKSFTLTKKTPCFTLKQLLEEQWLFRPLKPGFSTGLVMQPAETSLQSKYVFLLVAAAAMANSNHS
jgi:hypothetical protein